MITLSYNFSPVLKTLFEDIDQKRRAVLLALLSPRLELDYRFEILVTRVHGNLWLSGSQLTKRQITQVFSGHKEESGLTKEEKAAVGLRRAFSYLTEEWSMSPKHITFKTLTTLHQFILGYTQKTPRNMFRQRSVISALDAVIPTVSYPLPNPSEIESSLRALFIDLQMKKDHPIAQAGIAQIQLIRLSPFKDGNGRVARLLAYLLLYKYGYDCRQLLELEEFHRSHLLEFQETTLRACATGNITLWLEYFGRAVVTQMSEVLHQIQRRQTIQIDTKSYFKRINDRQKNILIELDHPETVITNRKVQKRFRVSQITASRDLRQLVNIGLLFSHGKGRSVYYTKV